MTAPKDRGGARASSSKGPGELPGPGAGATIVTVRGLEEWQAQQSTAGGAEDEQPPSARTDELPPELQILYDVAVRVAAERRTNSTVNRADDACPDAAKELLDQSLRDFLDEITLREGSDPSIDPRMGSLVRRFIAEQNANPWYAYLRGKPSPAAEVAARWDGGSDVERGSILMTLLSDCQDIAPDDLTVAVGLAAGASQTYEQLVGHLRAQLIGHLTEGDREKGGDRNG